MTQDDWVYGLFQSERTRGLSGPMRPALALDANNPFYNFRLWRHACNGSFLDNPNLLWKHPVSEGAWPNTSRSQAVPLTPMS